MRASSALRAREGYDRGLRVLQVASTAVGGSWFRDQVTGLAGRGHTVCAVLPGHGPLAEQLAGAGIQVEIIPFGLSRRLRQQPALAAAQWRLLRFVRDFRPDVIHAHLIIAALACRVASAGWPAALRVTQVPGMPSLNNVMLRSLDRCSLSRDHLVIGSCAAIADQYRAMGARHVAVSYYGCDVRGFRPPADPGSFRREFGLADGTPTVGMVAHMYPSRFPAFGDIGVKGHEVFIDAAPLILRKVPGARLFVVGDSLLGRGEYRRQLEARAAGLGLTGRMHFTGHRSDIAAVMSGLDVVVNPSMAESACYTMVEALLMERGVVASNVGGLPDTVQHGTTGLLVPPGSAAALADAVTFMLVSPAARRALGRRGREHCLRQFDINATVAQIDMLYRTSLARLARTGSMR